MTLLASQNCIMHCQRLPPELWLEVFNWAAFYPSSDAYTTDYKPFSGSASQATDIDLQIKCTLTLVCREWHAIVTEFLYRDVRINGRGQNALKSALDEGNRRFVRRAVLPYDSTSTPKWNPEPLPSVEILKLCNQLEILVRPGSPPREVQRFEFDIDSLPLPSLKRLEWTYNFRAEKSGGINSLHSVLQNAPHLQYMAIDGISHQAHLSFDAQPITLPILSTLALNALNGQFLHQLARRWSLPSLSHLTLGSIHVEDPSPLWEKYAEQLRVLELGQHVTFLWQDVVTSCLDICDKLEELNYHVFYALPPDTLNSYSSVTTIGLHSAFNIMFDGNASWLLLERHLELLSGDTFPSLRTVNLYGDWSTFVNHPRFLPISTRLRERGCEIIV